MLERHTQTGSDTDLFVGVGRTADVEGYLQGVGLTEYAAIGGRMVPGLPGTWTQTDRTVDRTGGAPAMPPEQAGVWEASTSGGRALVWRPSEGEWTVVVMRVDGQPDLSAQLQLGATLPGIGWIAGGILAIAVLVLAAGAVLVGLAASAASRRSIGTPAR